MRGHRGFVRVGGGNVSFRGGFHDFTIEKGGLSIYPRLIAAEHHAKCNGDVTPSGNADMDTLLGGGLERGTNALFIGAAGVGKSSLDSCSRCTSMC